MKFDFTHTRCVSKMIGIHVGAANEEFLMEKLVHTGMYIVKLKKRCQR
jgi:hypothetical protein